MTLGQPGRQVIRLLDRLAAAELNLSTGQASTASLNREWPVNDWELLRSSPVMVWAQRSPIRMEQGIYAQKPADKISLNGRTLQYQGARCRAAVKAAKRQEGRWEYHRNRIVLVTETDPAMPL